MLKNQQRNIAQYIYQLSKEKNATIKQRGRDDIIKQYRVSYNHRNNNNAKTEIAY